MSKKEITIDICIATHKRPALLRQLLESINRQKLPPSVYLKIIVVDNDVNHSAQTVVSAFKDNSNWPVKYDIEPMKNIARARNRALFHAKGDYVLFVDDDEYASDGWISNLLQTANYYKADVVFGPVLPIYPKNTPGWIIKGKFFERPRFETGTVRAHGGTGNTFVKRNCLSTLSKCFDPQYGVTGGEDVDLFNRLKLRGYQMVWSDEALVYEHVPYERMAVRWLTRRALRGGQTFGRIFQRSLSVPAKVRWLMQRFVYLVLALVVLPFAWVVGKSHGVKVLQKVYSNFGQLTSIGKYFYQEYR